MTFEVRITPSAQADLEQHADFIALDSRRHAAKWLEGAWRKIFALEENPKRFAVIEESDRLGIELRDFIHHSHRIVYRVREDEQIVDIIRVWPSARRAIDQTDLK